MEVKLTPFGRLETRIESLPTVTIDHEDTFTVSLREASRVSPVETPQERERRRVDETPDPSVPPGETPDKEPVEEQEVASVERKEAAPEQQESPRSEEASVQTETRSPAMAPSPMLQAEEAAPKVDRKSTDTPAFRPLATPKAQPIPVATVSPSPSSKQSGGGPTTSKTMVSGSSEPQQTAARSKIARTSPTRMKDAINRVELARDQKDSIFTSITLALSRGRSEVLILLDPPELGALGIRLKMEGNTLSLQLGAERAEVAMVLQEHGAELRQLLAGGGLNVTSIDVQTDSRQEQHRKELEFRRQHESAKRSPVGTEHAEQDPASPAGRVFVKSGSGIDFLV